MEICSSCFRCCLIPHNQNWELSVGVAGTKFTNPLKGRRGDSRRASRQNATLSNLSFARMCDNDLTLQVNVSRKSKLFRDLVKSVEADYAFCSVSRRTISTTAGEFHRARSKVSCSFRSYVLRRRLVNHLYGSNPRVGGSERACRRTEQVAAWQSHGADIQHCPCGRQRGSCTHSLAGFRTRAGRGAVRWTSLCWFGL